MPHEVASDGIPNRLLPGKIRNGSFVRIDAIHTALDALVAANGSLEPKGDMKNLVIAVDMIIIPSKD